MRKILPFIITLIITACNSGNERSYEKENPKGCAYLQNDGYSYNKLLGGIHNARFTIKNTCSIVLKDVRVSVSYIKKNGEIYTQKFVDVPFVGANESVAVNAPDCERGTSVTYEIVAANSY